MATVAVQQSVQSGIKPSLHSLLQALCSDRPEQREMASQHLAGFGEAATLGLTEALGHARLDVRLRAAQLLGEIRAAAPGASNLGKAVPALVKMLNGRELAAVVAAATALGKIGGEGAIAALCQKANYSNFWVRTTVIEALADQASLDLLPQLLRASRDKQPQVRAAATIGLGHIPAEQAQGRLVQLLQDSDLEVRWQAQQGLAIQQLDSVAA
ncbi:MAG: hypothetical protein HC824_16280 [Synechococcales cyanobacterium RM1_1_8]|nr:hypothetical protein [Synechococcales cyanobacterium RM1_1_8]